MTTTRKLTPYARYIVNAVCARRGLPVEAVMGRNRNKWVSWARFEIWATLVRGYDQPYVGPYSASGIARMFGRDHSSVLHGLSRFYGLDPIPSKQGPLMPRLPDPDPPPLGCCMPPTPGTPTPLPEVKPAAHITKIPKAVRVTMTMEEARAFRAKCTKERRRKRRPIGRDDNFWLRSLRDQRAGAGDEHV